MYIYNIHIHTHIYIYTYIYIYIYIIHIHIHIWLWPTLAIWQRAWLGVRTEAAKQVFMVYTTGAASTRAPKTRHKF